MSDSTHNRLHLQSTALVTTLVVVGDWVAKLWALKHLDGELIPVIGRTVAFTLHKNYGVVSNAPIPLWIVLPLTAVIIIGCSVWLYRSWRTQHRLSLGIVVLIGGAIGNFADRLVHQFTTDYLLLFGRSVINLADVLIILGVLTILFSTTSTSPSRS